MKLFVVYSAQDGMGHGFAGRSLNAALKPHMEEVLESYDGDASGLTSDEQAMVDAINSGLYEDAFRLHQKLEAGVEFGTTVQLFEFDVDEGTFQASEVYVAVHHDGQKITLFMDASLDVASRALAVHLHDNGTPIRDTKNAIVWYFRNTYQVPDFKDPKDLPVGFYDNLIGWLNESSTEGLYEVRQLDVLS